MLQESSETKQNRESIEVDGTKEDLSTSTAAKASRGDALLSRHN